MRECFKKKKIKIKKKPYGIYPRVAQILLRPEGVDKKMPIRMTEKKNQMIGRGMFFFFFKYTARLLGQVKKKRGHVYI